MYFKDIIGQEEVKERLGNRLGQGSYPMRSYSRSKGGPGRFRWLWLTPVI